jgi:hypothetical protein
LVNPCARIVSMTPSDRRGYWNETTEDTEELGAACARNQRKGGMLE